MSVDVGLKELLTMLLLAGCGLALGYSVYGLADIFMRKKRSMERTEKFYRDSGWRKRG